MTCAPVERLPRFVVLCLGMALFGLAGCSDAGTNPLDAIDTGGGPASCALPSDEIFDGGPGKDGIPALTDPTLVGAEAAGYLSDDRRVIGLVVDGQAVAVPHNILWWHEIVNFNFDGRKLVVTYCPLTGSSMAFERAGAGGAEFGVSGLLYKTNLIMYDRNTEESLWPQMARGSRCGLANGQPLTMYPVIEMTWGGWQTLHPDTRVLSNATGFARNYRTYPYGGYEVVGNADLIFPVPFIDDRRQPKERVLGIPVGARGGMAFPFGALDTGAPMQAVQAQVGGGVVVVFWDAEKRSAMAYRPVVGTQSLTFEVREGQLVDSETGSRWTIEGRAVDGPLVGEHLEPIAEAYVAFWFAWAVFQDQTDVWEG